MWREGVGCREKALQRAQSSAARGARRSPTAEPCMQYSSPSLLGGSILFWAHSSPTLAPQAEGTGTPSIKACRAAITAGFKKLDEEVLKKCAAEGWIDGATAVAAWAVGNTVLVANVGDARAVLARRPQPAAVAVAPAAEGSGGAAASVGGGTGRAAPAQAAQHQQHQPQGSDQARAGPAPGQQPTARPAAGAADGSQPPEQLKAVTLTREHKAIFPQERQRIERAGGFVSADGRLGGAWQRSAAGGGRQGANGGACGRRCD